MTANFDNSAVIIPGCVRDAATGALLAINSDGSINIVLSGTKNIAAGAAATDRAWIPGTVRDPVSGTPMAVNNDGSINVANK